MVRKTRGQPLQRWITRGLHTALVVGCLSLAACGGGSGPSGTDNEVVASFSPVGPVSTYEGKTRAVTATFATNDGRPASALIVTSGLASLPSGWSSASDSFACRTVAADGACVLTLTYAPRAQDNGVLTLEFSYKANNRNAKTATARIEYSAAQPLLKLVAGSAGGDGTLGGTGNAARFANPVGLDVDADGTIVVAEMNSNIMRRITPTFDVTTLAGSPPLLYSNPCGSADGTGAAARFCRPADVAIDAAGTAYVVEMFNSIIRKVTRDGVVTTLAGAAEKPGSDDGTGDAARFNWPEGIAIDAHGTLYVADTGNCTVRQITPGGVVTTYAGRVRNCGVVDGPRDVATLGYIRGIAIDSGGTIYYTDRFRHSIRKISPAGVVTTLAGSADISGSVDGVGTAARFSNPYGIAVDESGTIFVVDRVNGTVRKITPQGVVSTLAGVAAEWPHDDYVDGTGSAARFRGPTGIARARDGTLYVSDEVTIRRITAGGVVTTVAGEAGLYGTNDGPGTAARFREPQGVGTAVAGKTYVADTLNHTIRAIAPEGAVTTVAGSGGVAGYADGSGSAALFRMPRGVATDGEGVVYAVDSGNHTIRRITSAGAVTVLAGTPESPGAADGPGALALFNSPQAIARDAAGTLYVADTLNHSIRKISPAGAVTTLAGAAGQPGAADGTGAAARFNSPQGIGIDGSGTVYVADTGNNMIRRVTAQGVVTTLAGTAACGFKDGSPAEARFCVPRGLVVDSSGNVLVADMSNHVVRRITQQGTVTTVIGDPGQKGIRLGAKPWFLSMPTGVALQSDGELLITDGNAVLATEGF